MKIISFIIPSRNNLPYLKQAYNSIRKHLGGDHEIIMLDDASEDNTWEWLESLEDPNIIIYRNKGPDRVGHTILYDKGVDLSTCEAFSIFHADMIASPNYVKNLTKHLKEKTVVAATRIEPPLHPPGPEKIVKNFGMGIEEFNEEKFLKCVKEVENKSKNLTTPGIFAPWCMYKKDFIAIGGHDELFAPMELEDSDIFNRMLLAGYKIIQSRDSFVYHMTCRGSRFKNGIEIEQVIDLPDGTKWYKPKDSEEYKALRQNKFREWWRKWGQNVLHDDLMMPLVRPKYNIGIRIENGNLQLLEGLEPWCDHIYVEQRFSVIGTSSDYIEMEQSKTHFDLRKRVHSLTNEDRYDYDDILVEIDGKRFSGEDYKCIQNLSGIIEESGEIGSFELGNLKVTIIALDTYENDLIINKKKEDKE